MVTKEREMTGNLPSSLPFLESAVCSEKTYWLEHRRQKTKNRTFCLESLATLFLFLKITLKRLSFVVKTRLLLLNFKSFDS